MLWTAYIVIRNFDVKEKEIVDINQFVMESTERGQDADKYVRELRDNDINKFNWF